MTPFNVIRFGLGKARTYRAFKNPKYEQDWVVLERQEIIKQHERMMELLPQPFGIFRWLMELVGPRRAIELDVERPPNATKIALDFRTRLWAVPATLRSPSPGPIDIPNTPVKHIPQKRRSANDVHGNGVIEITSDEEEERVVRRGSQKRAPGTGNQTKHVSRQTYSISPPNTDDDNSWIVTKKPRARRQ